MSASNGSASFSEIPSDTSFATSSLPDPESFSSADFNAVNWVNSFLPCDAPDASFSQLSSDLEAALSNAHATLDVSLKRALSSVPWAVRETEKVRQKATALRAAVDGVSERVSGVEAEVTSSVDALARADEIILRVEATRSLLSRATEAGELQTRLDALLSSAGADGEDLVVAADVVAQLRSTLAPLENLPELSAKIEALREADAKLESRAAPHLRNALQRRDAAAARNARIVFDRAGRDNAFVTQYVAIRSKKISEMWTVAWKSEGGEEDGKEKTRQVQGDLSAFGAKDALAKFYSELQAFLLEENEWLKEAFPQLQRELLPRLLQTSLGQLKEPSIIGPVTGKIKADGSEHSVQEARALPMRMNENCQHVVSSIRYILNAILPENLSDPSIKEASFLDSVAEAVTAALLPVRIFLDTAPDLFAHAARCSAAEIKLKSEEISKSDVVSPSRSTPSTISAGNPVSAKPPEPKPPTLEMLAQDLESLGVSAVNAFDQLLVSATESTCGVLVSSLIRVSSVIANSLSSRLRRVLAHPHLTSSGGDEWSRISGSLRVLRAAGDLQRSWRSRKESAVAVAIGTAASALDASKDVAEGGADVKLKRFLSEQGLMMAGLIWEVGNNRSLADKAVRAFENVEENEFMDLMEDTHHLVYKSLFEGVKTRFASFDERSDVITGADFVRSDIASSSDLAFSSSPRGYATEVADYLMTVPQQLEPFVPDDDDDAKNITPKSLDVFRSTSIKRESSMAQGDTEDYKRSFAGMWIGVLGVGTMDLFVEKCYALQKVNEHSAKQLFTDSEYLCNVLGALGVAPSERFSVLRDALQCAPHVDAFRRVAEFENGKYRHLVKKIAESRGVHALI